MVVVLMGVAGSGKSTIGRLLARALGADFHDADDLHQPENRDKMRRGIPLSDDDRRPWLAAVHALIDKYGNTGCEKAGVNAVVACSALKEAYRATLFARAKDVRLVYLKGSPELIAERLGARRGHFFDPALLRSQFDALQEPHNAIVIDIAETPPQIVDAIMLELRLNRGC
jgi:gluconokinase